MGMTRVVRSVVVGETEGEGERFARGRWGRGARRRRRSVRRGRWRWEIIARVRRHGVWDADGDAEISV